MDATPEHPRAVGRPAVWTALAWCAAVAYPVLLFFAVRAGPYRSDLLRFVLALLLTALPLGLLRRAPLPALALMSAGVFAAATARPAWGIAYLLVLVNDVVVGRTVATRPRRVAVPAAVMVLGTQIAAAARLGTGRYMFVNTVLVVVLAMVAAWGIGHSVRQRREHALALRERAAEQAVTAERLRIARELHDMIAHSIGVIAIQAGMGSRVIDNRPAEARQALRIIEATSRETLAGLRRTLGALRRTERDPGRPSDSVRPDSVPLEPAPGLADLDRLAAATLDAGVRVEVRRTGESGASGPLPADLDLAAFRIVQEALTNVVRHAHTGECLVTVGQRDGELSVEITDEGRGGLGTGAGYGIVGMRERVALLDGRFTAGPRPEGGFRVAACLPVPVPVSAPIPAPASAAETEAAR
ncbi:histidine kinase [Streptomyces sp. NPDC093109]|uniref:sensor histidine kinase n=1 Tax=Streptomyces sp. NPDC093109 TaxID=3154977 RepID=UPI00344BE037